MYVPLVFRGVTLFASWQTFKKTHTQKKIMRSVESRKFAISMLIVCTCVHTVLEVNEVPAPKVESASSTAKSGPVTNFMYYIILCIVYVYFWLSYITCLRCVFIQVFLRLIAWHNWKIECCIKRRSSKLCRPVECVGLENDPSYLPLMTKSAQCQHKCSMHIG